MSEETKCQTCKFWDGPMASGRGNCHRYPPQMIVPGNSHFPITTNYDWCGEHQPKQKPRT